MSKYSSEAKSKATIPQKYRLSCAVKESHDHPIYCAAFSRHVHLVDDGKAACFATCGGPYATVYEVTSASNDSKSNGGNNDGQQPLTARQVYRDVDDGETFYTCAFGGRGVGSSMGQFDPVAADGDDGSSNQGNSSRETNIICFGDDKQQQKKQHHSKRPAKRQKQSDVQTRTNSSHSQLILPYYDTQNGPPLLCLAGTRGVIKVIDTYRRCLFMTLSGHGNDITDLKFSPTNEWLLLSSSKDDSIRLWNLQRGVNVAVFTGHNGHRGQVLSVSWHLSGTKFASCGMDNMIKLWKVFDGDKEKGKGGHVEAALKKSFSVIPDDWDQNENGREQVCQTKKFGTVFQQFPYFSTNKAHNNYVDCVQFVGDLILSKSVSNKVILWKPLFNNEEDNKMTTYTTHRVPSSILFLREFKLEHCDSWYVRFDSPSPYHQLLALGNQKGEVKVWKIGGNENDDSGCHPCQKYFCNLTTSGWFGGGTITSTVRMVAFNPHGSHLVAVRDDSTVWMWDAA
ncbi:hypothetical protein ACHAXR_007203 [Thalassiosira sp. AJA248-18]